MFVGLIHFVLKTCNITTARKIAGQYPVVRTTRPGENVGNYNGQNVRVANTTILRQITRYWNLTKTPLMFHSFYEYFKQHVGTYVFPPKRHTIVPLVNYAFEHKAQQRVIMSIKKKKKIIFFTS